MMVKNWKTLGKNDDVRELCKKYPDLLFKIYAFKYHLLNNSEYFG